MTKQEKSLTMTVLMTPDMANFSGNVHVARSSMEIGVKVVAEHLRTNEKRYRTSCYFTRVAIDEKGKSVEVPRLKLETDAEKTLCSG